MLRILHTESSCGWGGQEIRILTEISGMKSLGHDVRLACVPDSEIHKAAANKYKICCYPVPIKKKSLKGIFSIASILNSNNFDLINTHSSTDTWLSAVAMRLFRTKLPLVRTRHVSSAIPNNYFSRWLYTKATDHIITTGEKLRYNLIDQFKFSSSKVTSIPTGIDLEIFHPAKDKSTIQKKLGISPDKLNLLIVATLRSWKGHEYLLQACVKLKPNVNFHLYIIGDGPQRENLVRLTSELKLEDSVSMKGHIEEPAEWFQACDIFVLPSYANEGVPQSLIQAMACGTPTISTNVGSIGELIEHNKSGVITETRSAHGISNAIESISQDPILAQSISTTALANVRARFSLRDMLHRTELIMQQTHEHPFLH